MLGTNAGLGGEISKRVLKAGFVFAVSFLVGMIFLAGDHITKNDPLLIAGLPVGVILIAAGSIYALIELIIDHIENINENKNDS